MVKVGDIFQIKLKDNEVGYFQYLLLDPCQINSEVIRVFCYRSTVFDPIDLKTILASSIDFYAHVVIQFGIKLGIWRRIGNCRLENNFERPLFRDAFGHKEEYDGNNIIYSKSNSWNIWRAGDAFERREQIGELTEKYKNIDTGLIHPPNEIIHRMLTGKFSYPYYT